MKKTSYDSVNGPNPAVKKEKTKTEYPKFSSDGYYFETKNRRFWSMTPLGWVDSSVEDFKNYLSFHYGISTARVKGSISQCDQVIVWLQRNQWVNVTTDLAGYFGPAVIEHNDVRMLIKHAPKLIEPKEGEYPTLLEFTLGMVPGEAGEHLNCWSASVVQCVYTQELGSFIVPILCGPRSCGKSLFQKILTEATGGRSSRPYQVMTGGTPFNEHLFAAEHLMIEDEYSCGDLKSRNQLGTALKNFVANEQKLNHGKNKVPFMMPQLLQFLTISLNDELENIAQLPQKHPSLDHKLSLYACEFAPMPMPTDTPKEKALFWAQLMKELPAWIYDLLYKTPMPERWQDGRFMVAWRSDKILTALDELQPEIKLRELVQALYWNSAELPSSLGVQSYGASKIGSATDIESDLRHKDSPVKAMADDLLRNPAATGRYLTRLCERYPWEFSFKRTSEKRIYTLNPPRNAETEK